MRKVSAKRIPPKASGMMRLETAKQIGPDDGDVLLQLSHQGVTVNGEHTVTMVLRNPERVEKNIAMDDPDNHFVLKKWWFLTLGAKHFEKPIMNKANFLINCTCPDFYYTWGIWVYNKGDLIGQKPPPYKRKTPPPGIPAPGWPNGGYPYRNPGKHPGGCKHVYNSIQLLRIKGYLK